MSILHRVIIMAALGFTVAAGALSIVACSGKATNVSAVDPMSLTPPSAMETRTIASHRSLLIAADSMRDEIIALSPYALSGTAPVWTAHTIIAAHSYFPLGAARDSDGRVFATMRNFPGVAIFDHPASSPSTPDRIIAGPHTQFDGDVNSVAVDGAGKIYVTSQFTLVPKILVFAPTASGDASPIAVIAGPHTGITGALVGITVDSAGRIYVVSGSVLEFAAGVNGDVPPIRTIGGVHTGLVFPFNLALDPNGNIYVAESSRGKVLEFAASARGDEPPIRTLAGVHTTLIEPVGIAICGDGTLYVADGRITPTSLRRVVVFAAGWNGDSPPRSTIFGNKSQITAPFGLNLY